MSINKLISIREQVVAEFNDLNKIELGKLVLLCYCLELKRIMNTNEFLHTSGHQYKDLEAKAIKLQLEYWQNRLEGVPYAFLLWIDKGVMGRTQQPMVAEALLIDKDIDVAFLLTDLPKEYYLNELVPLYDKELLFIPDKSRLIELNMFNLLWAWDYHDGYQYFKFPKDMLRIVQSHGMDVPVDHSLCTYGAGIIFDHIFYVGDILGLYNDRQIKSHCYLYPNEVIDHSSETVFAIAVGNLKVDALFNEYDEDASDIIYSLSSFQWEELNDLDGLRNTIRAILEQYPQNRLVFRPFPDKTEMEQLSPLIQEFMEYPNFYCSIGNSYIKDYSRGRVFICHRGSSGEVFSIATGNPVLLYKRQTPNIGPIEFEYGVEVHNDNQLLDYIEKSLSGDFSVQKNIENICKSMPNRGDSLKTMVDTAKKIAHRKQDASWKVIPIRTSSNRSVTSLDEVLYDSFLKVFHSGIINVHYAVRLLSFAPNNIAYHYYYFKCVFVAVWDYPNFEESDPKFDALESLQKTWVSYQSGELPKMIKNDFEYWIADSLPFMLLGYLSWSSKNHSNSKKLEVLNIYKNFPLEYQVVGSWSDKVRLDYLNLKKYYNSTVKSLDKCNIILKWVEWRDDPDYDRTIIMGAGNHTDILVDMLGSLFYDIKIDFIVDSEPVMDEKLGLAVKQIDTIKLGDNDRVIISSKVFQSEMIQKILKMNSNVKICSFY